jgi:hypothetical protein
MGTLTENKETAGVTRQQKFIYFAFRWASRSREKALNEGMSSLLGTYAKTRIQIPYPVQFAKWHAVQQGPK